MRRESTEVLRVCLLGALLVSCGVGSGGIAFGELPEAQRTDPIPPAVDAGVLQRHDSWPGYYAVGRGERRLILDPAIDTVIEINGQVAALENLKEGMYVQAYVRALEPTLLRVDYNVAGGVPARDPTTPLPTVFGANVFTSSVDLKSTVEGLALMPSPGVAVSGYTAPNGAIDATAVLPYSAGGPKYMTGFARDVDTASYSFNLGGQTIRYSGALSIDTATGGIEEWARLRVQLAPRTGADELSAVAIVGVPTMGPVDFWDARVKVDNYISAVIDADTFRIGDVVFKTNVATEFENVDGAALRAGMLVAIDGVKSVNGEIFTFRVKKLD